LASQNFSESLLGKAHPRLSETRRRRHIKTDSQESRKEDLDREIEVLKAELREREKALPAHSIRPHQLLAIEELEEKIRTLEQN
jgi:hypothetical protein